jgi:hypothetical protein
VADILILCPRMGTPVSTGLKTEWVLLHSLPRVAVPLRCPACGLMHKWHPQDAWIGNGVPQRAPTEVSQPGIADAEV